MPWRRSGDGLQGESELRFCNRFSVNTLATRLILSVFAVKRWSGRFGAILRGVRGKRMLTNGVLAGAMMQPWYSLEPGYKNGRLRPKSERRYAGRLRRDIVMRLQDGLPGVRLLHKRIDDDGQEDDDEAANENGLAMAGVFGLIGSHGERVFMSWLCAGKDNDFLPLVVMRSRVFFGSRYRPKRVHLGRGHVFSRPWQRFSAGNSLLLHRNPPTMASS